MAYTTHGSARRVGVLVVLASAVWGVVPWIAAAQDAPPGGAGRGEPVRIAAPAAAVNGVVQVPATLGAAVVEIRSAFDATVAEVRVKDGQKVRKGDLLFQLRRPELELDIEVSKARVKMAQAALATASANNANVQESQASLAGEEAVLAAKVADLANNVFRAPFDGVVSMADLMAGLPVDRGTVLARVVNTAQLKVDFTVQAKDLPQLKVGQSFMFKSTSTPDGEYTGEITVISPIVDHTPQVVATQTADKTVDVETVAVRGQLSGNTEQLRSGMSGSVMILLPQKP